MFSRLYAKANYLQARVAQSVERLRFSIPELSEVEARIVAALESDGATVTCLDDLELPFSSEMNAATARLFSAIPSVEEGRRKQYVRHATPDQITEQPELLLWGLNERLLNIVGAYLHQRPRYRGVVARIDCANGVQEETRLWHKDAEDFRIVKFIVYLNDIGPEDGPFEFIPKRLTPPRSRIRFSNGRVLDDDMAKVVPDSEIRSCTGPAGTVVVADTCSVFHRGRPGTASDRHTLFYNYNAIRPLRPEYCERLYEPTALASLMSSPSPAQLAAVGPMQRT